MFNEDFVNATGSTPASGTCPITQAAEVFLAKIWVVDPKATFEVFKPDSKYPYPVFVLSSEALVEKVMDLLEKLPIRCPTYPSLGFAEALCPDGVNIHLPVPYNLLRGYVSTLEPPSVA
ncbi:MAG: hypothetical protein J0L77_06740 [Alphaproteobacteria bacterium]|nr:hypothetical protein [Alphaproteobacteria bacterium]